MFLSLSHSVLQSVVAVELDNSVGNRYFFFESSAILCLIRVFFSWAYFDICKSNNDWDLHQTLAQCNVSFDISILD